MSSNEENGSPRTLDRDFEAESDYQDASPEKLKWAQAVIRLILSRDFKGQSIRREHFNEANTDKSFTRRVKFEEIFALVQKELRDVFGLTLEVLTPKDQTKGNGNRRKKARLNTSSQSQKKPENYYVLTSVLSPTTRQILGELWQENVKTLFQEKKSKRSLTDQNYFRPFNTNDDMPSTNLDLVKYGLLLLVAGVIIFGENRVSEKDLLETLADFGLSNIVPNTSINLTATDLLTEFVKRDYVQRYSTTENSAPDYGIGPKLLAQLKPKDMFELVRGVFGDTSFDLDVQIRVQNSIQRVYKEQVEVDNEGDEENAEDGNDNVDGGQ